METESKWQIYQKCMCTYSVHDCVGQQNVADVDSGNQANKTRDDIRVVHVYGLSYGLEAKQQSLCVLQKEKTRRGRWNTRRWKDLHGEGKAELFRYLPYCWLLRVHQVSAQPVVEITEQLCAQHLIHIHQSVRDVHPRKKSRQGNTTEDKPKLSL